MPTPSGGAGDDVVIGGAGVDTLSGGPGVDVLNGGGGADSALGGTGNDTFVNQGSGNDTLNGGAGLNFAESDSADTFIGIAQVYDAVLPAGAALPSQPMAAFQTLEDAGITPTVALNGMTLAITAGTAALNAAVTSDGQGHLLVDLHDGNTPQTFSAAAVSLIQIIGSTNNDTLAVASDALTPALIKARAGDDSIIGGGGNDTLRGVAGNDTLDGGPGDDSLRGGGGNDSLLGGTGDDVLAPGNDPFSPGNTSTLKSAPDGNDTVIGGDGFDIAEYVGRTDNLTIAADGTADSGNRGAGEADQIGTDVEALFGGFGADSVGSSTDTTARFIAGGDGADNLQGGTANDTVVGGPGPDTVNANGGFNFLFMADSPKAVDHYAFVPGQDFATVDDGLDVANS